jgi:hypothetical protein
MDVGQRLQVSMPAQADLKIHVDDASGGHRVCHFSPVMGPSIFGQGGPLLEVTIARLLTRIRQTIGVCQGHGVDSVGTSFPGS